MDEKPECGEMDRDPDLVYAQFCFLPPGHEGDHEGRFGIFSRHLLDDECEPPAS